MIEHRSKAAMLAYAGGGGVPHRHHGHEPGSRTHVGLATSLTRALCGQWICEQHGPLFWDKKLDQAKATPVQLFRHHTA